MSECQAVQRVTLKAANRCVKMEFWRRRWRAPIKRRGARGKGGLSASSTFSFWPLGSPRGATNPARRHLYANKFSSLNSALGVAAIGQTCAALQAQIKGRRKTGCRLAAAPDARAEFVVGDTEVNKAGRSLNAKSQLPPL